jgi:hypothetical protein
MTYQRLLPFSWHGARWLWGIAIFSAFNFSAEPAFSHPLAFIKRRHA